MGWNLKDFSLSWNLKDFFSKLKFERFFSQIFIQISPPKALLAVSIVPHPISFPSTRIWNNYHYCPKKAKLRSLVKVAQYLLFTRRETLVLHFTCYLSWWLCLALYSGEGKRQYLKPRVSWEQYLNIWIFEYLNIWIFKYLNI